MQTPSVDAVLQGELRRLESGNAALHETAHRLTQDPSLARAVVGAWEREIRTVPGRDAKLVLLYLCDQILTTSREHTAVFVVEFMGVLQGVVGYVAGALGADRGALEGMVAKWDAQKIFAPAYVGMLHSACSAPPDPLTSTPLQALAPMGTSRGSQYGGPTASAHGPPTLSAAATSVSQAAPRAGDGTVLTSVLAPVLSMEKIAKLKDTLQQLQQQQCQKRGVPEEAEEPAAKRLKVKTGWMREELGHDHVACRVR